MEIAVIGISHKEAPVPIRGLVAFTSSMKKQATENLLSQGIKEFMIISTCNRSEIYIATKNMSKDTEIIRNYYIALAGYKIEPYIFIKRYETALHHIYQVAAGLNSLIIGENEILGQMKKSLEYAIEHMSSKKYLTKVIREAITFSKKIRHAYKLSENQLSVAAIGVKYLKDYYGDIKEKKILLIGTGEMGQLILKYLETEGYTDIFLTNRTYNKENVAYYAGKAIETIEYHERYDKIHEMDIVISATASPHLVVKAEALGKLDKEITFLDMAVPRDIDPILDQTDKVNVVTLDDFYEISDRHLKLRHETADQINRLIYEEVKELELWILRTKVDGVIKELHKKQESIIRRNIPILNHLDLDKKQDKAVRDILKSATWAMIKEPVDQLKSLKDVDDIDHYKMIIERLFDFDGGVL